MAGRARRETLNMYLKRTPEKAVVMKLGGSQATDVHGVREGQLAQWFQELGVDFAQLFSRAAFVIGGGQRVRAVQAQLSTNEEKDLAGLQVLQEHAGQVQRVLSQQGYSVHPRVPGNSIEAREFLSQQTESTVALGGLQIGQSTDTVAVTAAEVWQDAGYEAIIVILSNIWNIFTADPKVDPNARPVKTSSIDQLVREGVLLNNPADFRPGMNVPLDPVAVSRLQARQKAGNGIRLWLGHMDDLESTRAFLEGRQPLGGTLLDKKSRKTKYASIR